MCVCVRVCVCVCVRVCVMMKAGLSGLSWPESDWTLGLAEAVHLLHIE